ncbi:AMP-binding protein [Vibrio sp. THAF190c]|uniref:AMP-binding protein n=1 Tax=Vibrio sp. THAF190c TaxID=2587865 RepID=UPI001268C1A4|nr:AMP-binding protein [Vibrio sp. THAF190c]QFT09112.1 D-alanine--poly(phosphoribitol) ligase subunit 1 [Vibrio sp. THAF190c]
MNQSPRYTSLAQLFQADRSLDSVICFDDKLQISWQEFHHDVAKLCGLLSDSPAQRTAICTQDSYLFTVAFMACALSSKQIVLPGNYQPEALYELRSEYDLLLVDESIQAVNNTNVLLLSNQLFDTQTNDTINESIDLGAVKLVLFTSGSSGTPKAIHKTLQQLDIEIAELSKNWQSMLTGSRVHSTVSHQHIYGLLFRILWPLCSSVPFSRFNLEYPEQIVSHADSQMVLVSSPALLKRLSEEQSAKPLVGVFSSGGPLPLEAAQQARTLFGELPIEVFGSTETGGIAYRQQVNAQTPWQLFSCIKAELNQENCIKLLSPYIDRDNWYQTADECEMVSNNQFILKGRTDRIIKIEEKRISLVEVEKRLEQLSWINECAVIPFEEPNRLILASVIVLSDEGKQMLNSVGKGKFWLLLRNELRKWLEPIAVPRRFRVVEEIPLNSQGKRLTPQIEQIINAQ